MKWYILLFLVLTACHNNGKITPIDRTQPIVRDGNDLERYETPEVVCFEHRRSYGAMWCHWKGKKNGQNDL